MSTLHRRSRKEWDSCSPLSLQPGAADSMSQSSTSQTTFTSTWANEVFRVQVVRRDSVNGELVELTVDSEVQYYSPLAPMTTTLNTPYGNTLLFYQRNQSTDDPRPICLLFSEVEHLLPIFAQYVSVLPDDVRKIVRDAQDSRATRSQPQWPAFKLRWRTV